jgi:hypothetical protein
MKNAICYLGLATLFTHELDAIANHEWQIMPVLRSLPDMVAYNIFVFLHVPLFAILIALVTSNNHRVRRRSRLGLSAFLLVHAALHAWFSRSPGYEFDSILSNTLVFGGALLGAIYLAIHRQQTLSCERNA